MPGKKYYVVWKGKKPGIYDRWKDCEAQIKGVEGARYKSFPGIEEARRALDGNWADYIGGDKKPARKTSPSHSGGPVNECWCVDAACSGNPGVMEYRCVEMPSGRQVFHKGPFPLGTNNIGEFLAIVHALALLRKENDHRVVYTDSRTALKWLKDQATRTKLPRNAKTGPLLDLLDRAQAWLRENEYINPVLKWDTENWGEIPADFGRK